jgi:hypothetical protein
MARVTRFDRAMNQDKPDKGLCYIRQKIGTSMGVTLSLRFTTTTYTTDTLRIHQLFDIKISVN